MTNFKAIAFSLAFLAILYIMDSLFPAVGMRKDYFSFTYSLTAMGIALLVGLIQIMFYTFSRKVNTNILMLVAGYSLVFAAGKGLTIFSFASNEWKTLWLFVPPLVFYFFLWFTNREKNAASR